jgi:hypothetical protein
VVSFFQVSPPKPCIRLSLGKLLPHYNKFYVKPCHFYIKLSVFFPPGFRSFILLLCIDIPSILLLFCFFSVLFLCICFLFHLCPVYCHLIISVCMLCCNWPFGCSFRPLTNNRIPTNAALILRDICGRNMQCFMKTNIFFYKTPVCTALYLLLN